jgi:serine/threonine protein kinase
MWRKHPSFEELLQGIVCPIVFCTAWKTVMEDILDRYFMEVQSGSNDPDNSSQLKQDDLNLTAEKHIVQCYAENGYILAGVGTNVIWKGHDCNIYLTKFNCRTVALKLPSMKSKCSVLKYCSPMSHTPLANELTYLGMLKHANILSLVTQPVCSPLHSITEYCGMGKLSTFLQQRQTSGKVPTKSELIVMLLQIVDAVLYIHSKCVVHCNLRAANVLLQNGGSDVITCKLTGFDIALRLPGQTRNDTTTVRCPSEGDLIRWLSRESLLEHQWSTVTDVWMMGRLAHEMFAAGALPFPELPNTQDVWEAVGFNLNLISFYLFNFI